MTQTLTGAPASTSPSSSTLTAPATRTPAAAPPPAGPSSNAGPLQPPALAAAIAAAVVVVALVVVTAAHAVRAVSKPRHRSRGRANAGPGDGSADSTAKLSPRAASRAGNLHVPQSAMNPDFEYALPRYLALLATELDPTGSSNAPALSSDSASVSASRAPVFHPACAFKTRAVLCDDLRAAAAVEDETLPLPPLPTGASDRSSSQAQPLTAGVAARDSSQSARRRDLQLRAHQTDTAGLFLHRLRSDQSRSPDVFPSGGTDVAAPYTVDSAEVASADCSGASSHVNNTARDSSRATVMSSRATSHAFPNGDTDQRGLELQQVVREDGAAETGVERDAASAGGGEVGGREAFWRVQRQLDLFGQDDVLLGRFTMLGREHRRRGGAPPAATDAASATRVCARVRHET